MPVLYTEPNIQDTFFCASIKSNVFYTMTMNKDFSLQAYAYHLPEENIAQRPADKRDNSRLMVVDVNSENAEHKSFSNIIDYIQPGDMLVVNNTKVFPARLTGFKESGGKIEAFLLELPVILAPGRAEVTALLKSSRKPKVGSSLTLTDKLQCTVLEQLDRGKARLELSYDESQDINDILSAIGEIPLPPYIKREEGTTAEDTSRYQTVYANAPGAVAAPTAGLHFTEQLLNDLKDKGVHFGEVTLHVGYGTFAPVHAENIKEHQIHHEFVSVTQETSSQIAEVQKNGGRIWAVGTTSVRSLEYAARENGGQIGPVEGWCDLYIYPGFIFKTVDNLITNFHLPDSSLMFLVSAICGREKLLRHYQCAVEEGYRFFSYGDAMALITKK